MHWMQINLVGRQRLNRVWFWGKEGSEGRDRRRRANGGDREERERKEHVRRRRDAVIARPIHPAMPAGMCWGQCRTTQLQPVLVCCAQLHCVPTMFCCLLLHFSSCSSPLVSPLVWFLPLFPAVDPCSVADSLVFLFFCFIMFELTAEAVTK